MAKISFLDRRDSFDRPITYSSQEKSCNDTLTFLNELKKFKTYNFLIKHIDQECVNIFLYKVVYDAILPINNIYILDNSKKEKKSEIIVNPERFLLNEKLINHIYPGFIKNYKIVRKNLFNRNIIKIIKKSLSYIHKIDENINDENIKKIAIRVTQKYDDFKSKFIENHYSELNNNIIYYFEDIHDFKNLDGHKYLKYFKKYKLNYVVIKNVNNEKNLYFDQIISNLKLINCSNYIEIWLKKILLDFLIKINYWNSFFTKYNIHVHEDAYPNNINNIIKYTALKLNKGVTFSIQRSYPMNYDGVFASYYNSDFFFCWGQHSKKLFKKTININHNFIETGVSFNPSFNNNINKINEFFQTHKVKYRILLLDTNHSYNDISIYQNYDINFQIVYTASLEKFYMKFFELIQKNKNIGLIIKPKKISIFNELKETTKFLDQNIDNLPVYLIKDPNHLQINNFKDQVDLVVNISFYTPSIFMESIILGYRTICYDYSNIFSFEKKDLDMDKEISKNISNNLGNLILQISKLFKDIDNNKENDYGKWSKKSRSYLGSFLDGNSKERIMDNLKKILENL